MVHRELLHRSRAFRRKPNAPGIQQILHDAGAGKFDIIILSEAVDRVSRDQEVIAGIYERMRFAGVKIVTLTEGEVGDLQIGFKGTMNALYLKDLADNMRRGIRGRVEEGKSGGGNSFGYDVVRSFDVTGAVLRGRIARSTRRRPRSSAASSRNMPRLRRRFLMACSTS